MSHADYDLIVMGTGPSASTVATKIREQGRTVAIIENRPFGGTCALRGCNPKKVYTNAGSLMAQVNAGRGQLISIDDAQINWSDLAAFKREFTDSIPKKSRKSFEDDGIDTFSGTARFTGPKTVTVDDVTLSANRVFIGVGARPVPLDIPGAEHVIHSDDFMELDSMPTRVAFIGGGYVSMEFAHVVARYGSRVTVVQRGEHILAGFDPDLTSQLADYSKQQGIDIHTSAEAKSIEVLKDGGFRLTYERSGDEQTLECDLIIHGAGRVPNIESLDLERGNVQSDSQGIVVDKFLRSTSNPIVFAAGDCAATGQPKLTPTANEQARAAVKNLFDDDPSFEPDYGCIPQVAFTTPAIAAVGLSQKEASEKFHNLDVRTGDSSDWGSMRKIGIRCGGYKILVDDEDRIVGAHLLGHAAEETINLFALAMKFGLTATDFKSTLFAFPTFASDVRTMV